MPLVTITSSTYPWSILRICYGTPASFFDRPHNIMDIMKSCIARFLSYSLALGSLIDVDLNLYKPTFAVLRLA